MKNIIAHRGFWLEATEQNTEVAFRRALSNGFGIETDLRDRSQSVVISHDMASPESMTIEHFLKLCTIAPDVTLALNIKADGLQASMASLCIDNPHFYFDMSVPDMLGYLKSGVPLYTRYSNIESEPALLDKCEGVWLDNFDNGELDVAALQSYLELGKHVVLVSPELHKRDEKSYWKQLKTFLEENESYENKLGLCTDFPLEARSYFNEQ
jgi:glycerophosphoryl diester phosphodiesterase